MTATTTRLADYTAPAFWIDSVDLTIDLDPVKTRVLSKMRVRRNPHVPAEPLKLDGKDLNLARVLVAGQGTSFKMETMPSGDEKLVLEKLPEDFEPFDLEIFTTCNPSKNTSMSGLYVSNDSFFTQCEAEGFRRITYFLDRPDVMASYAVTLRANQVQYPVLLSNGNLVEQGLLEGAGNEGRHFAKWVDPHKKPCYLFALVAGLLVCHEQKIKAKSGSEHLLQVYVRPGDLNKTQHAMRSLMASIAWDEARFGLSLDLERFMIVAVGDFNMGAMENKGLNIFNTKYVLATQNTATDTDFAGIESVVAHEYFHNWTGNRVTCRDWFQLSLKEGLTVFRDQEFSMDMSGSATAAAVQRIEDVRNLRTVQFGEDAGPMSHPVRPAEYSEINNFYTPTVYEKGAEVVRMMQSLVGRDGFAAGMKLYFQRHDGQAVTCDDFAAAISDANPTSLLAEHLAQFKNWYSQAGTPHVAVSAHYDAAAQVYVLELTQKIREGQQPFVIPFAFGLLSAQGTELAPTHLHVMTQMNETIRVGGIASQPIPSLLRGFSAPVIVDYDYQDAELQRLMAHDTDAFNRWEAAQRLMLRQMIASVQDASRAPALEATTINALRSALIDAHLDAAFRASILTVPSESVIAEALEEVDPQRIHFVRESVRMQLATELQAEWQAAFDTNQVSSAYVADSASSGKRTLANMALAYVCLAAKKSSEVSESIQLEVAAGKAYQRFKDANNMTDRLGALLSLMGIQHELAADALVRFHRLFANDDLVVDKWFALQASQSDTDGDVLPLVKQLLKHPDFKTSNPNRFRSLVFSYCSANPAAFHRLDAAGYVFWSEQVVVMDAINPQVAARLARALERWKKLAEPYKSAARVAIERVAARGNLSRDVREVVTRALA